MSKGKVLLFIALCLMVLGVVYLLVIHKSEASPVRTGNTQPFRIVFYNTENLFDTINDPATNDNDFTPEGKKKWTSYRYHRKLHHTFQALSALATPEPPVLIGLCEVENRQVVDHLRYRTPLNSWEYALVHKESPDPRGIDVALLYRPERYTLLESKFYKVKFPSSASARTRDILFAQGIVDGIDTLVVLVNHWSSRIGDPGAGVKKRVYLAQLVKDICDSVYRVSPETGIVIMGDLNDEPSDSSLQVLTSTNPGGVPLLNLTGKATGKVSGSYKYKARWNRLDHIVVSQNLITPGLRNVILQGGMRIADFDFLLEPDTKYLDVKPVKTFNGMKYTGGYSDHLPVFIDLKPVQP